VAESKTLLLASAALLGIVLLSYSNAWVELGTTDLKDIDAGYMNSAVRARGVIEKVSEFSAGIRVQIVQEEFRLSVVYFTSEEIDLKKEMCLEAVGEIIAYKGSLELNAKRLTAFYC
jgi:hypothetical protein